MSWVRDDHTIFKSICAFRPQRPPPGLACNTASPAMMQALDTVKWDMINEWDRTKKHPSTPPGCTTAKGFQG